MFRSLLYFWILVLIIGYTGIHLKALILGPHVKYLLLKPTKELDYFFNYKTVPIHEP